MSSVSRADLKEDSQAKWYVEFHHLITQAISAVEYRQYNYTLMMSHSTQLARWLHKYLVNKFTYAQIGKVFEIRFSTVKRDSGLLEAYSRSRDAIDAVNKALEELKQKGVLESIQGLINQKNGLSRHPSGALGITGLQPKNRFQNRQSVF